MWGFSGVDARRPRSRPLSPSDDKRDPRIVATQAALVIWRTTKAHWTRVNRPVGRSKIRAVLGGSGRWVLRGGNPNEPMAALAHRLVGDMDADIASRIALPGVSLGIALEYLGSRAGDHPGLRGPFHRGNTGPIPRRRPCGARAVVDSFTLGPRVCIARDGAQQ